MKKQKQYLSLFLTLVLLICTLGTAPVYAARESHVEYVITGSESSGEFIVNVSIHNVRALAGKLAISFDSDKLQLKSTSSLVSAVKNTSNAVLTTEGLDPSVLLSNQKGYVMFAWYASNNSGVDATQSEQSIASIPFTLKNDATTDDFSRNTLGIYYVNDTMADKWTCSANIISNDLISYKNTAADDSLLCGVSFDYPNCEYVPAVTYSAAVKVSDTSGNPLSGALVSMDSLEAKTDGAGNAVFEMENGVYSYRISAAGYETKSGYIIVDGKPAEISAQLKSFAQFAQELADNLSISFAEGDSESSVTASVGLPENGEYGETITWQSSDTSIVANEGTVYRPEEDAEITLTATVTYASAAAVHTFKITVKSRLSAEEKNAAIVKSDTEALEIGYAPGDNVNAVTMDISLPATGANGSAVAWTSTREEIISQYGEVTRPEDDTEVTLTAMVMRGTASRTKEFKVTVSGMNKGSAVNDSEIVNNVLKALEIGYSGTDTANRVTQQLKLPVSGVEDTIINWESSHPAVVTAYGGVVRQAKDCDVTLTATVTKGAAFAKKQFALRVLAAPLTPVNPGNGQENDIIQSNNNRNPTGSGTNVEIVDPSKGPNGGEKPNQSGFTDLKNVPWAVEAIEALSKREIIKGTSATTFSPEEQIKRCDFVMLLMRMLNQKGEIAGSEGFADVAPEAYYYEPITLAKSLGLITGVGDNRFDPDGNITRQDMLTMTYRALRVLGMADSGSADLTSYPDAADIAEYAYESVSKLVGAGYIKGDEQGKLNPIANTTRAETAVFLYRLGI